jgi:hypothetical protein
MVAPSAANTRPRSPARRPSCLLEALAAALLVARGQLVGRLRLLYDQDAVPGAREALGHGRVGGLREAGVRLLALHEAQAQDLGPHLGVHLEQLVELAHLERGQEGERQRCMWECA